MQFFTGFRQNSSQSKLKKVSQSKVSEGSETHCCETCLQSGVMARKLNTPLSSLSSLFSQFWLGPWTVFLLKDQTNFCYKAWLHTWYGGHSMTLHWGDIVRFHSFQNLPCLRFGPLKGILNWQIQLPSSALSSVQFIRWFQNYREVQGVSRNTWGSPDTI